MPILYTVVRHHNQYEPTFTISVTSSDRMKPVGRAPRQCIKCAADLVKEGRFDRSHSGGPTLVCKCGEKYEANPEGTRTY